VNYGGEEYPLEFGPYEAVITEVGATLRSLRFERRDLVVSFPANQLRPLYRGALLVPWPNRIVDGRYSFGGTTHQLPLNEPERQHALHGLVCWASWRVVEHAAGQLVLGHRLQPRDGYPFRLDMEAQYTLNDGGLTWGVSAINTGDTAAPYGCGPHPYLVAGEGRVDDWRLDLPADRYLQTTNDRLVPTGMADVADTQFDFRRTRAIRTTTIDHAFTGLHRDPDGWATAQVTADSGHGVHIRWEASCPWVQVHTADRPEPECHRIGLAVEPMTCPPDAFNSGTDLVLLAPGESHKSTWLMGAV
jgi:aldose 1-epimerase